MKRIAGASALLLLTGMCGCISVAPPAGPDGKSAEVTRRAPEAFANGSLPPATAQWTPPPDLVDQTTACPAAPSQPQGVVEPAPLPPLQKAPAPPAPPAPTQQTDQPPRQPVPLPEMPDVTTPKGEQPVRPTSLAQDQAAPAGTRMELPPSRPPVPPAPTVKSSQPPESRQASASGKGGPPLFRLVNTRRITLNFAVQDVGASGVAAMELWFTQDGKVWKKLDAPPQAKAYPVEVDDEGTYGFTLLARSGTGMAKEPPQPGDSPQVWVIVDLTKPEVQLTEATPGLEGNQQMVQIKWKASDKNLGRQPITLSYAEKEEGPWKVIAAGLDNQGSYTWEVPKGTPAKVLLRVEAIDLAGNVGRAQMSKRVLMDTMVPTVKILEVDANGGR